MKTRSGLICDTLK